MKDSSLCKVSPGGAQKKVELPLKLLTVGDFSNGKESRPLSERKKINVNKNNLNSVLSEFNPEVNMTVPNTLEESSAARYGRRSVIATAAPGVMETVNSALFLRICGMKYSTLAI